MCAVYSLEALASLGLKLEDVYGTCLTSDLKIPLACEGNLSGQSLLIITISKL